jgi:hypothetical protein
VSEDIEQQRNGDDDLRYGDLRREEIEVELNDLLDKPALDAEG